ncbi:MAG: adenosylcobinamide amidohydrolase [Chlorobiales bacterium]|nr:adenosylcobinamide amidohydrolase [Chlorobiales bacterium]
MRLGAYGDVEIHRKEKIILIKFLKPHRVISTCPVNGGVREDLDYLFNHQACEPSGHFRQSLKSAVSNPQEYHKQLSKACEISENTASLATAANMNNAAIEAEEFDGLRVIAICTGGVETNAGRAGDPATFYEKDGNFHSIGNTKLPEHGTINIMVVINREVTEGAMVKAISTATEAKTAVLQELAINSRYSDGLATGTGTDQIGIACSLTGDKPLTYSGKHSKLGELIGKAVKRSVKNTLALQNQVTPHGQCSVKIHIERFGATRSAIKEQVSSYLPNDLAAVFINNFEAFNRDPVTVAAVAALVHVRDKIAWGILPETCMMEIFSMYGAQIAASVSQKYENIAHYRECLSKESISIGNEDFLEFIYKSCALGYSEKWSH